MRLIVAPDAEAAAERAAHEIAAACNGAIAARGAAIIAISGGETPWGMLRALVSLSIDWPALHVLQVDERVAPDDDPRRNLIRLRDILVAHGPLPVSRLHAMSVTGDSPDAGAAAYAELLQRLAGRPPQLDVVQLGLGADGHTASLFSGDAALDTDADVAVTGEYAGTRRMTLTLPTLSRARLRVWLVTGSGKRHALEELVRGDGTSPAGRVERSHSCVVTDQSSLVPALAGRENVA
jgi:6-phosphogluconolactonase